MTKIEDPRHFLDLAFEYYMTSRFAAINQLNIAPNLMHHAIELLIKFTLLKDVPQAQRSAETERLRKKYEHRLNALWNQYKQYVAPTDLSRFDAAVADLHRWENIRYGGFPNAGASVTKSVGMVRAHARSSKTRDIYVFGLHEMDDLFTAMFAANISSINPPFIGMSYAHAALREWYARNNQHIMPDLFGSLPLQSSDP
jgi:hypothetical protein